MGREHIGARKLLYFCIAGVICFLFLGCSTPKAAKESAVDREIAAVGEIPDARATADPQAVPKPAPEAFPEKEVQGALPEPGPPAPRALPQQAKLPPAVSLPSLPEAPAPSATGAVQAPAPPVAEEPPKLGSPRMQRARKLLAKKDYEASLKLSERVLLQSGSQCPADEALFSLGLIYAHQENPRKDYGKALGYFQRLLKEFPKSPLADEAKAWAGVLQENQNLKQVIEKTKEVDIAVDEKRREKGR